MRVEIDQSGKIEDTSVSTVLAFSNGKFGSIIVGGKEKRELQKFFRDKNRGHVFTFQLFAVLIFLLIKNDLKSIQHIVIDLEYVGKEYLIKDYLLREIRQVRSFDKRDIDFRKIGKKSRAHDIAINVFRKKKEPNKVFSSSEIIKFFNKKTTQALIG